MLLALEGHSNCEIARRLQTSRPTIVPWRRRSKEGGIDALSDASRSGRKKRIRESKIERIVDATLFTKPLGSTHWSTRLMADKMDVSQTTVNRTWRENGLKPHRSGTFKLSKDPKFASKVRDIAACTSIRRIAPWCSASMRRARCRHLTGHSRCYQ